MVEGSRMVFALMQPSCRLSFRIEICFSLLNVHENQDRKRISCFLSPSKFGIAF